MKNKQKTQKLAKKERTQKYSILSTKRREKNEDQENIIVKIIRIYDVKDCGDKL